MNTLLANAEVPGLFEGDEFASLMTACKEGAQRQGLLLDSQESCTNGLLNKLLKPRGFHHESTRGRAILQGCNKSCALQSLRPELVWRLVRSSSLPGRIRAHPIR
jgi:hypothetical protein